jgi:hypothetical protein
MRVAGTASTRRRQTETTLIECEFFVPVESLPEVDGSRGRCEGNVAARQRLRGRKMKLCSLRLLRHPLIELGRPSGEALGLMRDAEAPIMDYRD